jgi:hypothetical protein
MAGGAMASASRARDCAPQAGADGWDDTERPSRRACRRAGGRAAGAARDDHDDGGAGIRLGE